MIAKTTFIICAAGAGARFQSLLPWVPKPLIKLNNQTLLEWSLASLPILATDDVIIVTQHQDNIKNQLSAKLAELYPFNDFKWLELTKLTRGQLDSVWQARDLIDLTKSLTIYNSDSYFQSPNLSQAMRLSQADGIIPCSQQPGNTWSFCQIDNQDNVVAVTEKIKISDWVSIGLYFFRDTPKFLKLASQLLKTPQSLEYYVAPLYQKYLELGDCVKIDRLQVFKPMGTPEQIWQYWGIDAAELISQNQPISLKV